MKAWKCCKKVDVDGRRDVWTATPLHYEHGEFATREKVGLVGGLAT
jgi:hypothetical protein